VRMYRSRLKNQCAGCRVAGQTIAVSLRRRDTAPFATHSRSAGRYERCQGWIPGRCHNYVTAVIHANASLRRKCVAQ
jgi:hypothetical protein